MISSRPVDIFSAITNIMAMSKPHHVKKTASRDRSGVLYVVLGDELISSLDAWISSLNTSDHDGPRWDRTSLVRMVLRKALRAEEDAKLKTSLAESDYSSQ